VGTLRAILRKHRLWANIQPDVQMLRAQDYVGRALTQDEEKALLNECRKSRSQFLFVAVETALGTCMRYSEIRLLRWNQIDFAKGELRVGKAKTEHGEGRVIPLSRRVHTVLEFWAERFSARKPNDFVFPFERYGGKGKDDVFGFSGSTAYSTNPSKARGKLEKGMASRKEASRCNLPLSRSSPHRVHPDAGSRGSVQRGQRHHGLECKHRCSYGETIWSHRTLSPT
jgi:integrase